MAKEKRDWSILAAKCVNVLHLRKVDWSNSDQPYNLICRLQLMNSIMIIKSKSLFKPIDTVILDWPSDTIIQHLFMFSLLSTNDSNVSIPVITSLKKSSSKPFSKKINYL